MQDNREGLVLLMDAIEKAGYTGKVKLLFYLSMLLGLCCFSTFAETLGPDQNRDGCCCFRVLD